jgi:ubiquinone/menaquinone biosynthesis C-methylase UbiE
MLSVCTQRAHTLGIRHKCEFLKDNFFVMELPARRFDGAVIGFFLGHVPKEDEELFFKRLGTMLQPQARVLIIDSAWTTVRALRREKHGMQERTLSDGRAFSIYKRYFLLEEIHALMARYGLNVTASYHGDVFLATVGERHA